MFKGDIASGYDSRLGAMLVVRISLEQGNY